MKWSRIWRQWFMMAGILLWIGILGPGDICRTGNRMSDRREWQGFDQRRDRTAAGRMVLYRGKRQRAPA